MPFTSIVGSKELRWTSVLPVWPPHGSHPMSSASVSSEGPNISAVESSSCVGFSIPSRNPATAIDPSGRWRLAMSSAMPWAGFGEMPPYSPEWRSRFGPERRTVKCDIPRRPAMIAGLKSGAADVSQTSSTSAARRRRSDGTRSESDLLPDSSWPSRTILMLILRPSDAR